MSIVVS